MKKLLKMAWFLPVVLVSSAALFLTGCGSGSKTPKVDVNAQIEALKGTDAAKKQDALANLSQAGPAGAPAVPELIQALKDPEPLNRSLAAAALGSIGKPAAAALPDLKNLLGDSDRTVMMNAMNAMRNIDPSSVDTTNPPNTMTP